MKVVFEINEETFLVIMGKFSKESTGDYYTINPKGDAGYNLTVSSATYTTSAGNTWGVKTQGNKYTTFYEGRRSRISDLLHLLTDVGVDLLAREPIEYVTSMEDMRWYEDQQGYLIRMGKEHLLEVIPAYKGNFKTQDAEVVYDSLPRSVQGAIDTLYGIAWYEAIFDGRA